MEKLNIIILPISTMLEYVQEFQKHGDTLDWTKILELEERSRVVSIQIHRDDDEADMPASLMWGWKETEIKIGKIEVDESFRKNGIGSTMMEMFFAIANFYKCSKIVGVVSGEKFLWNWYRKLGFDIYDENKLLIRFDDA